MASGELDGGSPAFGPLLRSHRVAAGLTQEALAEAAGLSARAVRALEAGERTAPHRDTVRLLAGALPLSGDERAALEAGARRPARRWPTDTPTPTRAPGALPVPLTPLVGREREVAAIRARLGRGGVRLLTLIGTGGVGKTRLALHAAAGLGPTDGWPDGGPGGAPYPDGVRLAALAALRDPALVPQVVAAAVGVREEPGRPLVDTLADALRPRRLLLVLDNCEHVLPGAAPAVAALLAACPRLAVLATSRGALRLTGEHEYPVLPLPLPAPPDPVRPPTPAALSRCEAVALFAQRAAAVRPDFALTGENAPAVAEVCRRLDGLPLAIELAAAQVKVLPPRALLARLSGRLAVLVGGPRDAPARQQTLRATLDWSHALLDGKERVLFRRLAVFAGGWTLDAAEAVCNCPDGSSPGALPGLGQLLDKSLLRQQEPPDGEPRFAMLETVREYALERLEQSGEAAAIRRRHAGHFLAMAERAAPALAGPGQRGWLERLEAEHDNLRAALGWSIAADDESAAALRLAGALGRFWEVRGHLTEGRRWLERALAVGAAAPPRRGRRRSARPGRWPTSKATTTRRRAHSSSRAWRSSVRRATRGASPRASIGSGAWPGSTATATWRGRSTSGAWRCVGTVATARAPPRRSATWAVSRPSGATARARAHPSKRVLELRRELGDRGGIATSLSHLGRLALDEGNRAAAGPLLEEALASFRELGDKGGAVMALWRLAELAEAQEDYSRAEALLEERLALLRDLGRTWEAAPEARHLGRTALRRGDLRRATALVCESLAILRERRDERGLAWGVATLAGVAAAAGRHARAARLLGAAAARIDVPGARDLPADRAAHDCALAATRAHLDDGAFAAAWASGQAMTLEQTVAYALEAVPEGPGPAGGAG